MTESELPLILSEESLNLYHNNRNTNPIEFSLNNQKLLHLPIRGIAELIDAYQRALKKFSANDINHFLLTKKGVEQSTSALVTRVHCEIIKGKSLIDLSGGLGFDALAFSKQFETVDVMEIDYVTFTLAKYNLSLKLNVNYFHEDSIDFLKKSKKIYDWIYVDPDRRTSGKREMDIRDHKPNCVEHFNLFKTKARSIAIKYSPFTDISQVQKLIPEINEIHVVSIDNECKEVLFISRENSLNANLISAWMINSSKKSISMFTGKVKTIVKIAKDVDTYTYLIEPDKAIIKSKLTNAFCEIHELSLIHEHTDYLLSHKILLHQCRCFKIISIEPYNIKQLRGALKSLNIDKANISKRNFLESTDSIRKKLKLKDGGEIHLHFTKNSKNEYICIITRRILRNSFTDIK